MIRRTLALAGAAVLTAGVTGLAGPAAADQGAGISVNGGLLINEVGAELDPASAGHDIDGGFIELINDSATEVEIAGLVVRGCTTSNSGFDATIGAGVEALDPDETYLIGDPNFDPSGDPADQPFPSGGVLEQAAGGVAVFDPEVDPNFTSPLDEVMWGPDDPGVACAVTNAGIIPDDDESINRDLQDAELDKWDLNTPTPEPMD